MRPRVGEDGVEVLREAGLERRRDREAESGQDFDRPLVIPLCGFTYRYKKF